MSYQALYRKFRPQDFSDVKGQDHIVKTLKNQVNSGRIGHAYIFCGTRGTGKTTMAKIMAKVVNCENPTENGPCGECPMCKAIQAGASMNVVEMDAASNNGVDNIRTLIEEVQYSPAQGKYKVYIIDEAHMITPAAFNALLKTLEEPPSYLIFIFATTEVEKLPITIQSRCQRYDFKRISVDTIAARLQELLDKEGIAAEEKAVNYIARKADGALRDGLSLLEQCISFYYGEELTYDKVLVALGIVDQTIFHKTLTAVSDGDIHGLMEIVSEVVMSGKELGRFTVEMVNYLRDLLIVKTSGNARDLIDTTDDNYAELEKVSALFEEEVLFRYIRIMSELSGQMKVATQKRVVLEVALIKLCKPEMEKDRESLIDRIGRLEDKLEKGQFTVAAAPAADQSPRQPAVKRELPKAIPEDVKDVIKNWANLVLQLDDSIKTFFQAGKPTLNDDGKLAIYFEDELSVNIAEESKETIQEIMRQMLGKEFEIDIRKSSSASEHDAIPDLRDILNPDGGLDIDWVD